MKKTVLIMALLSVAACAPTGSSQGNSRLSDRFMQADANGDGFVSRAEAPSRIDFDAADSDGDGLLSLSEIEIYTQQLR